MSITLRVLFVDFPQSDLLHQSGFKGLRRASIRVRVWSRHPHSAWLGAGSVASNRETSFGNYLGVILVVLV